ncbi:MAG: DUF2851 family protein [Candidatus Methylacidiphilales bacterium]
MEDNLYGRLRLREAASLPLDEHFVQRLWFEQLFRNPLKTLDGLPIRIIQPGFWNRGAGPDFLNAAAVLPGRGTVSGPVEIHLDLHGFKNHGHHDNPAYGNLLLHGIWMAGPGAPRLSSEYAPDCPQLELQSQLSVPLSEARASFALSPGELSVGARAGRCRHAVATLSDSEVVRLIEEAGWFRFQKRVSRWGLRIEASTSHLLWEGLAEVLGYSHNREAMVHLSRLVPWEAVCDESVSTGESLLFGAAGWLNAPPRSDLPDHLRSLWDSWWKHRGTVPEMDLALWKRSGLRPLNRPERRIAALAWFGHPDRMKEALHYLQEADHESMRTLLLSCRHPEWDHRCSLQGKRLAAPVRLIGSDRVDSFLFNVFWPLAYTRQPEKVRKDVHKARTARHSLPERRASFRLLQGRVLSSARSSLLCAEGMEQIYQDFCLTDHSACEECSMTDWIQQWRTS